LPVLKGTGRNEDECEKRGDSEYGRTDKVRGHIQHFQLRDSGHQAQTDFGATLLLAGKIFGKELFFVKKPPDEAEDREDGRDESPIGAERQGRRDEVHPEYIGFRTTA